ncbi:MAG: IS200/IS605 family transposase [Candidatus Kapaibacterium sp.]
MSHSFHKIWIHAVWATKERKPLITPQIEQKIYRFIASELGEIGCPVRIINGMPDHIHCLFRLHSQRSIAQVVKQIKGSSSHYINLELLLPHPFAWQTGYAAFSVSESGIGNVVEYIKNQKLHHQRRTYIQEYGALLKAYGVA